MTRSADQLNQLRTLAHAVVSLTNFKLVAAAEEDQLYFTVFERHALIAARHQTIKERGEVLYNVQAAAQAALDGAREQRLNGFVSVLTGLTFLTVFSDTFAFIWHGPDDFTGQNLKWRISGFLVVASLLLTIMLLLVRRPPRGRKS